MIIALDGTSLEWQEPPGHVVFEVLEERCEDQPDSVRGAMVLYSKRGGTMTWGHASMRFVGCEDGRPLDVEFESYKLTPNEETQYRARFPNEAFASDDAYWASQRGSMILFVNPFPVDLGFYGEAQAKKRDILELWLPGDQSAAYLSLIAWHEDQLRRMRNSEDLEGRYGALSTNCTTVMQRTTGSPWHLPFRYLRENPGLEMVLHPSPHTAHKLARAGHDPSQPLRHRPKALFRRLDRSPEATAWIEELATLGPRLPGTVEAPRGLQPPAK